MSSCEGGLDASKGLESTAALPIRVTHEMISTPKSARNSRATPEDVGIVERVFLHADGFDGTGACDAALEHASCAGLRVSPVVERHQDGRARRKTSRDARAKRDSGSFLGAIGCIRPTRHVDVDRVLAHGQPRGNVLYHGRQDAALRLSNDFVAHHAPNVVVFSRRL